MSVGKRNHEDVSDTMALVLAMSRDSRVLVVAPRVASEGSRVRRKEEDFLLRRWRRCWPERRTTAR